MIVVITIRGEPPARRAAARLCDYIICACIIIIPTSIKMAIIIIMNTIMIIIHGEPLAVARAAGAL